MDNEPVNTAPRHVAIIMDGNGRWAKARGLERVHGHVNGVESIRKVIRAAIRNDVQYLTLFAFSTENWGRPAEEVGALIELLCDCISRETPALKAQGVRLRFIGGIDEMSDNVQKSIAWSQNETAACDTVTLAIAVNYSSRWEITRMVRRLAAAARAGDLDPDAIDAELISQNMTTADLPDPDLLIRTSGEERLSNFMLWQLAYSELYFTPVLWPDFDEKEFDRAIEAYKKRERRYGILTQPKS